MGATGKSGTGSATVGQAENNNNTSKASRLDSMLSALDGYDARYKSSIIAADDFFEREFPELTEIVTNISVDTDHKKIKSAIAGMGRDGELIMNPNYLNSYDEVVEHMKGVVERGWHAGNSENLSNIYAHEMGHRLDTMLTDMFSESSPKDRYGWRDTEAKYLTIGDKSYSYSDIMKNSNWWNPKRLNDVIVKSAMNAVKSRWKELGYSKRPTNGELLNQLSGYSAAGLERDKDHSEAFAEAIANYVGYGSNAKPIAHEVFRIAKDVYNQFKKKGE